MHAGTIQNARGGVYRGVDEIEVLVGNGGIASVLVGIAGRLTLRRDSPGILDGLSDGYGTPNDLERNAETL
jgi:hypothetical protein